MVGYHCSYTHRGQHYLLLEYADMDTLEDFMKNQRPPSMDAEIVAFWKSILHVIEAIAKIHDLDPDDGDENDPFRFIAYDHMHGLDELFSLLTHQ
jgi:serine/threonine protein kinase